MSSTSYGLTDIIESAERKFGPVIAARHCPDRGDYVLLISRDYPASERLPFMTIRAYRLHNGFASFEHGHYDLTDQQAETSFEERCDGGRK